MRAPNIRNVTALCEAWWPCTSCFLDFLCCLCVTFKCFKLWVNPSNTSITIAQPSANVCQSMQRWMFALGHTWFKILTHQLDKLKFKWLCPGHLDGNSLSLEICEDKLISVIILHLLLFSSSLLTFTCFCIQYVQIGNMWNNVQTLPLKLTPYWLPFKKNLKHIGVTWNMVQENQWNDKSHKLLIMWTLKI